MLYSRMLICEVLLLVSEVLLGMVLEVLIEPVVPWGAVGDDEHPAIARPSPAVIASVASDFLM